MLRDEELRAGKRPPLCRICKIDVKWAFTHLLRVRLPLARAGWWSGASWNAGLALGGLQVS